MTSDIISSNIENGEDSQNYFWENTVARAKGDWLGDEKDPVVNMEVIDGSLVMTAEVWGQAREITQALTDLKWEIQKEVNGKKEETSEFNAGDRIYVSFNSPADGYAAIYLIEGNDDTSCLLPYRAHTSGKFPIKGGKNYTFFDKTTDPQAPTYKMNTTSPEEYNQLVIIYSPNSFTKSNDVTGDKLHPNSLSTADFQKWLLKCQRADRDMVVNKKWIKIKQ